VKDPSARIASLLGTKYTGKTPGISLGVRCNGETLYEGQLGLANLEHDVPVTPRTKFNIASLSKQFTAYLAACRIQEGNLGYHDPITRYLPDFPTYGQQIEVCHLIHHTSGIRNSFPDLLTLAGFRMADVIANNDALALIYRQKGLNHPPGEEFLYSNSNYVLLAHILERVGKERFGSLCRNHIFHPLSMDDSVVRENLSHVYHHRSECYYQGGNRLFQIPLNDTVQGPTNIYTTTSDLLKWMDFLQSEPNREVWKTMTQPGVLNNGKQLDYCFGLEKSEHKGSLVFSHEGGHGGFTSSMAIFPEERLSVVLLSNRFSWSLKATAMKIADLFLPKAKRRALPLSPQPQAEKAERQSISHDGLEGFYYSPRRGNIRHVEKREKALLYNGFEMKPVGPNHFLLKLEPSVHVRFSGTKMNVRGNNENYDYEKLEGHVSQADLSEYSGTYHSAELQVSWELRLERGKLKARRKKYPDTLLKQVFHDFFSDNWRKITGFEMDLLLRFTRDTRNQITGFTLTSDGARQIRFEKA